MGLPWPARWDWLGALVPAVVACVVIGNVVLAEHVSAGLNFLVRVVVFVAVSLVADTLLQLILRRRNPQA